MEIWLCEGWLLLMLWKLNSNNFIFTEYTLLGLRSNPLAKIVVFMFFIHSGDIFCCRFHLGSRGGESCVTGERGARTGVSAVGAVSIVEITGFGNWTPGS